RRGPGVLGVAPRAADGASLEADEDGGGARGHALALDRGEDLAHAQREVVRAERGRGRHRPHRSPRSRSGAGEIPPPWGGAVARGGGRRQGCVITTGGGWSGPGNGRRTDEGAVGFKVGELDGRDTARVRELARVVSDVAPAKVTTNLFGERWSKLAVNCMANPLAGLSGLGTAEVRTELGPRRVSVHLAAEVI